MPGPNTFMTDVQDGGSSRKTSTESNVSVDLRKQYLKDKLEELRFGLMKITGQAVGQDTQHSEESLEMLVHQAIPLLEDSYQHLDQMDRCCKQTSKLLEDGHVEVPPASTPEVFIQLYLKAREVTEQLRRLKLNEPEFHKLLDKVTIYERKIHQLEVENQKLKKGLNDQVKINKKTKKAAEAAQNEILQGLQQIQETQATMMGQMATKQDLREIRNDLEEIHERQTEVTTEVTALKKQVRSMQTHAQPHAQPATPRRVVGLAWQSSTEENRLPDVTSRSLTTRTEYDRNPVQSSMLQRRPRESNSLHPTK